MIHTIKVGVVGPEGSASYVAALAHYDPWVRIIKLYNNSRELCSAVEKEEVQYGVVPLLNEKGTENTHVIEKGLKEFTTIPTIDNKVVAIVGQAKPKRLMLRDRLW